MGRRSKLTPEQWAEIERRLIAGDGPSDLAREYGVHPSQITRKGVAQKAQKIQAVAQKIAESQIALAELPVSAQHQAVSLAEKLRNISTSLACAAELGAKTAHRLQALANSEVGKVDDADPLQSVEALKGVSALTRLANDSSHIALNLLAANKEKAQSFAAEGGGPNAAPELAITVSRRAARA